MKYFFLFFLFSLVLLSNDLKVVVSNNTLSVPSIDGFENVSNIPIYRTYIENGTPEGTKVLAIFISKEDFKRYTNSGQLSISKYALLKVIFEDRDLNQNEFYNFQKYFLNSTANQTFLKDIDIAEVEKRISNATNGLTGENTKTILAKPKIITVFPYTKNSIGLISVVNGTQRIGSQVSRTTNMINATNILMHNKMFYLSVTIPYKNRNDIEELKNMTNNYLRNFIK